MTLDYSAVHDLPSRSVLLLPAGIAARLLVTRFTAEAGAAFERLDDANDLQALHDFRVGCRRLRSTIRAYRTQLGKSIPKPVRQSLRQLANASSESRDIEVCVQWLANQHAGSAAEEMALRWLKDFFRAKSNRIYPNGVRQALSNFPEVRTAIVNAVVIDAASASERGAAQSFAATAGAKLSDATRALGKRLQRVRSIADQNEAHRARIAGKRLRYMLEPLVDVDADAQRLVDNLKHLQDEVGAMRDASLLRSQIELLVEQLSSDPPDQHLREGLLIIAKRIEKEESRAWQRMRSRWSSKMNKAFFTRSISFAQTLTSMGALARKNVEIERKFLLRALPRRVKEGAARCIEIDQGWIPGEKLGERLRRARSGGRSRYYRTVKLGAGVRRIELEENTTRALFDFMWPLTAGKRVSKRRHVIRESGLKWEIDEFTDRELFLAEVELDDASVVPRMPRWLRPYVVREVTDEPEYVNRNLAR